jgi:serine phosphatase RsbU (regulator of sigma subunit)
VKIMSPPGLRAKALLAMLSICLLVLIPASLIGWQVLDSLQRNLAQSFVRNTTLLNRSKISAPLLRDLALAQRLAGSELTRQWLLNESSPLARQQFFREAEAYRGDLHDHIYFIGSVASKGYYLNAPGMAQSSAPRHVMRPTQATDTWFYHTLAASAPYNINIDRNLDTGDVKIWCNIKVMDGARTLGVAGSGITLSSFLSEFILSKEPGVTAMIVNPQGAIQIHPDRRRVAINSGATGESAQGRNLFGLVAPEEIPALRAAMLQAQSQSASVPVLWVHVDSRPRLLALSYIPELKWHVVTLLDLQASKTIDQGWLWLLLGGLLVLLLVLVLAFALALERVLLQPLRRLQDSARAVAGGQYDLVLPTPSLDEIGALTTAFATMTAKVRSNTEELERRVQERTMDLERANQQMQLAQKKIADSINYASLIQRAILPKPDDDATRRGTRAEVLWLPRDVVGGDFYLRRDTGQGTLLGVVDCAGHGVPGAMMTMLAYSALDQAISEGGMQDPACILQRADAIVRSMLPDSNQRHSLATTMDMGLAYIDQRLQQLSFAGAKMNLYISDGKQVEVLSAGRRALADTRRGSYVNSQTALLPGRHFYFVSDGFLDQAGGETGFGFGDRRFTDMILRFAHLPLREQINAFRATLEAYQGNTAQRDDITLLCFTCGQDAEAEGHHDAI